MEYFYDGQIRRYVTQFMRIFIGFKYQAGDGTHTTVPVMYGDMTRQVAAIIRENSENKMPSVPKIACYITGLDLDKTRLSDATFVSKMNIHERDYQTNANGQTEYNNIGGQGYTIERLMPTPFTLKMKADIWTSNTDQKLQLLEQILVLFNPSIELQTTDNYIDWTSLSVVDLESTNFSSRSIPAGTESDIDICSLEFKMPIYITPPAKVKRMGVVRDIVMNVFDANGDVGSLNSLIYNSGPTGTGGLFNIHNTPGGYGVLLLSANDPSHPEYFNVSVLNPSEAVMALGLEAPIKQGARLDWNLVLNQYSGKHIDGISLIHFMQPSGYEISGTFVINPLDPTILVANLDLDTIPASELAVNAIINPLTFNPRPNLNGLPVDGANSTYLLIDDIGGGVDRTYVADTATTIIDTGVRYGLVYDDEFIDPLADPDRYNQPISGGVLPRFEVYIDGALVTGTKVSSNNKDSTLRILLDVPTQIGKTVRYKVYSNFNGADAWASYQIGQTARDSTKTAELVAKANSIVQFDNDTNGWKVIFDPDQNADIESPIYMTNKRTGVQYKWDGVQWTKSFEGEYRSGMWRFTLP